MPPELSCGEARTLASDLLDGSLTDAQAESVKRHVAGCSSCPDLYRSMVAVHDRLAEVGVATPLPPRLRDRIRLALLEQ